MKNEMM